MSNTETIVVLGYDRYDFLEYIPITVKASVDNFKTVAHAINHALDNPSKDLHYNLIGENDVIVLDDGTEVTIIKTTWDNGVDIRDMIEFTTEEEEFDWNFTLTVEEADKMVEAIKNL